MTEYKKLRDLEVGEGGYVSLYLGNIEKIEIIDRISSMIKQCPFTGAVCERTKKRKDRRVIRWGDGHETTEEMSRSKKHARNFWADLPVHSSVLDLIKYEKEKLINEHNAQIEYIDNQFKENLKFWAGIEERENKKLQEEK